MLGQVADQRVRLLDEGAVGVEDPVVLPELEAANPEDVVSLVGLVVELAQSALVLDLGPPPLSNPSGG